MEERVPYFNEQGRTVLPGFGIPLNEAKPYPPHTNLFPSALSLEWKLRRERLIPLRELTVLHIMDELTSKSGWDKKIHDDTITTKWKDEMLKSGQDITNSMIEYIFDELRYKAEVFADTGVISVFDAGVVKSDVMVPAEFKAALTKAISVLEDVPDSKKDWHPGSNDKVLDLVHPSLFPLVYGQSRILPNKRMGIEEGLEMSGKGVVLPVPPVEETLSSHNPYWGSEALGRKFQWLPCEVDIKGERAKIASYINNLHPQQHAELYRLIEQLVDFAIPLWDAALTPLREPDIRLIRIEYKVPQYDPDFGDLSDSEGPQEEGEDDDEDEWNLEERRYEWWKNMRVTVQPEPTKKFVPPKVDNPVKLREQYKQHGLQVIVKLASIMLTPEKPVYEGGTWHVEGKINERIVASALYYYSSENITASKLAFRQQCDYEILDIHYEQHEWQWLPDVFGLENEALAVQVLGGIKTPEGRLLAFPNTLQHQVQPFKLEDPTKPGHRKIVALFLVDPNMKVISTANIPCQRKDWWQQELEASGALGKLPLELRDRVVEDTEFPFDMEQAKKLREELMEERKYFILLEQGRFTTVGIALCEH